MSYKMARIIFWIFAIVIGIGVYLGLRAVLIDIIRKTKDGYKDTFILKPSIEKCIKNIEDRIDKLEKDKQYDL